MHEKGGLEEPGWMDQRPIGQIPMFRCSTKRWSDHRSSTSDRASRHPMLVPCPPPKGVSTMSSGRSDARRMPRFFRRLFKFPQMDFELAVWEMTNLIIAPKKVFRSVYYHVRRRRERRLR